MANSQDRYSPFLWTALVVFAFTLRACAGFWWQSKADAEAVQFRFGDSYSYWTLAGRIANNEPYQYGSPDSKIFRAPLYPAFLSPFTRMDARTGTLSARLAGCILGAFCVYAVMLASQNLAGSRAAICSGILASCFPGAIGMSIFILSEAVFCPLVLFSIFLWHRSTSAEAASPTAKWFACASGLATGLACLARPSWILWPGALLAFILLGRANYADLLRRFAWFVLGMVAVMSPWWIRNFEITGRFVPTTLQVGATLYDSLHGGASGGSDENMEWVDRFASQQREEDQSTPNPISTFEYRLDRRMGKAAIAWAFENPSDVARLALIKFRRTWSPMPSAQQVASPWIRYAEALSYLSILIFSAVGCWHMRRRLGSVGLYVLPCFYFAGLHLIFVGSVRYRQPAVLILCVVAGIGLAYCIERLLGAQKAEMAG